ncbi:AP2/ERF and B3 domain-containing protein [Cinnamomum micranthum f. kanehirae]|uniref:AP2/ERF and B3 domain-containing protein n=1 Tax=Cinnamomum micranthum f. kanehirae TaxID=337451 RepID=A0A443N119_9MAGN|nr:AP2/ERF and B3 domain-containing protein [Cinnamomum micranthum f. kanehirae]
MEENTSNSTMVTTEGYDSNGSSSYNHRLVCKNSRYDNSPSSLRFKGVVLQQNGHWGAQIYANHQRIWLGTFKSERAAAMAYDSAAIKLHSNDHHRNFPWTNITIQEPGFQELYTTDAVLNMIKDGSYESKFADYIRTISSNAANNETLNSHPEGFFYQEGVFCKLLFQKELTPSDVGKLNRLVIPKKHATKYFPLLPDACIEGEGEGEERSDNENVGEDVELEFLDRNHNMRGWKFRYCYWKSSQSFVFTRGWSGFVKEKKLQAKDVVIFYKCEEKMIFCIDVRYNLWRENGGSGGVGEELELKLGLGGWTAGGLDCESKKEPKQWIEMNRGKEPEQCIVMNTEKEPEQCIVMNTEKDNKSVLLFGADISDFNHTSL